jgi:hypothetical protein
VGVRGVWEKGGVGGVRKGSEGGKVWVKRLWRGGRREAGVGPGRRRGGGGRGDGGVVPGCVRVGGQDGEGERERSVRRSGRRGSGGGGWRGKNVDKGRRE